ncbi:MAG: DUF1800 family protein, partial [Flavitalea sp.]
RGHYSEDDVKEAARSFTGWGANLAGEFVFRKPQHDHGLKTVLGKTGNFSGDEVLEILLKQKQTARFISTKIYRYFVNDRLDENKINWLSERFYQSNYNIQSLMKDIFLSDWFYDPQHIGSRIKSPVELLVGIRRILPMEIENDDIQLLLQRLLGQLLFYPPNVAGWPGGKNWIDSSSLMLRMRIPQMIYVSQELNMKPKGDDDQMMGRMDMEITNIKPGDKKNNRKPKIGAQIISSINWKLYRDKFETVPRESLIGEMSKVLLQTPVGVSEDTIKKFTDSSSKEKFIQTATIQLMSTPEYQLC